jgi:hypothetical protein
MAGSVKLPFVVISRHSINTSTHQEQEIGWGTSFVESLSNGVEDLIAAPNIVYIKPMLVETMPQCRIVGT